MRHVVVSVLLACAFTACGGSDESGSSAGGGTGGIVASGGVGGTASGGSAGAAGDSGIEGGCTPASCASPGHACIGGACVEDCRATGANACGAGTVCHVGDDNPGKCVAPGSGCVVTSLPATCGALTCGPGTRCDGAGACYPALPCKSMKCEGQSCHGTECACTRPPPACAPASLGKVGDAGTLNDPKFSRCGSLSSCDGGIFDLDFDQKCNAWGVTMISGTDYLRKIDPQGKVTEHAGVTNLNMGEVAAIQGKGGLFGGGLDDIALTYICCAACGCVLSGSGGNPQGVAALDIANGTLPMKIPTVKFSSGTGPFGKPSVDTGPYGLTWGLDQVLYVGNVDANGDYHALDLTTQTSKVVATFSKRVIASAPFDAARMMVVLEGGEVQLVPVLGKSGTPKALITLATHATSLVRDAWSGRIYAELGDKSIVSFAEDGSDLQAFQTAPEVGRITIAPDGYLYHLTLGWPTKAEIVRWQLPVKL